MSEQQAAERRAVRISHREKPWQTPTSEWSGPDPLRRVDFPKRESDLTWADPDAKAQR